MTKLQFLMALREKLKDLPENEIEERLNFYSEMIEDRVEDGLSEDEAILQIGSADSIATQIIGDGTNKKKTSKNKKKLKIWEIILIVIGSPLWLSLMIAAFAVVFALYIVMWALVISVWAVFVSLSASALCGTATGIIFISTDNTPAGLAMIAASLVCTGLSIIFFFVCKAATNGAVILTKRIGILIKKSFIKKEIA